MNYEKRPTWNEYFLGIAVAAKARANCPRGAYGAVITNKEHHILGMGYNGTPSSAPNCNDNSSTDEYCHGANDPSGDYSRCRAIHAEINAILNASNQQEAIAIYITGMPCSDCAKVLANTKIEEVHYVADKERPQTKEILEGAGKKLFSYTQTSMEIYSLS